MISGIISFLISITEIMIDMIIKTANTIINSQL